MRVVSDGCRGGSVDIETIAGSKTHGTDQCRRIDGVHRVGIIYGADDLVAQVVQAAMVVDDGVVLKIVIDAVDGQIARIGVVD